MNGINKNFHSPLAPLFIIIMVTFFALTFLFWYNDRSLDPSRHNFFTIGFSEIHNQHSFDITLQNATPETVYSVQIEREGRILYESSFTSTSGMEHREQMNFSPSEQGKYLVRITNPQGRTQTLTRIIR